MQSSFALTDVVDAVSTVFGVSAFEYATTPPTIGEFATSSCRDPTLTIGVDVAKNGRDVDVGVTETAKSEEVSTRGADVVFSPEVAMGVEVF